jgi:hypothetical protein
MKKGFFTATTALLLSLSLSGCGVLYPHWGATGLPTDSPSTSASQEPSSSASASDTPSASPSETVVVKGKADVQISMATVDEVAGVLTVVAEITNFSEDGGSCQLKFVSGGSSQNLTVKAEANATDTQCFPMEIDLSKLPSGAGAISVTYDSATHSGKSASEAVQIP